MQTSTEPWTARSATEPRLFEHNLDPDLFSGDRLDWLVREAERHNQLAVQLADPGKQRPGNDPIYTKARFPVLQDALDRAIQYRIYNVDHWAGPEYEACREHIFEAAGPDPELGRLLTETVVRVFSPRAVVALHGDPDLKLVCDISGETVWYVRRPEEMTTREHENLLRGEFFLKWREAPETALPIAPGTGCFVPSRWAHWLDHPTDEATTSFEMGFWTKDSIRARKIYDVNWAARKLHLDPAGPGGPFDNVKCTLFDLACTVSRKGLRFRGW
jgi:hypothetical protein